MRFQSIQTRWITALLAPAVALFATLGCGTEDELTGSKPPYDLTFALDATFQAPHGGQPIEWAVVRTSSGTVEDQGSGTISATQNPSFLFTARSVMDRGEDYEVHFWIDSNIGGGTAGVCDSEAIDHQWRIQILSVPQDVHFLASYLPAQTEDVCATFP
jgi:hypothetical protein